ncbi:hypothetical protein [Jiulongibacter sp. NS-SX5]|uniref:hypothetical protein n=1 Tax=Jiulongibacter sp. NS-SX5 TaxID=3463854 RepID=UPI00405A2D64
MKNRIIALVVLVCCAFIARGQSLTILPDSTRGQTIIADTVESHYLKTANFEIEEKLIGDSLNFEVIIADEIINPNFQMDAPTPLFLNQNNKIGDQALGFTLTIPAADFFPDVVSPIDNAASPQVGQMRFFSDGAVQGYGNTLYSLNAPLYLSLNNKNDNIYIQEIEICALDRNTVLDLFAAVYKTEVNTVSGVKSNIDVIQTRTTGAKANDVYDCWSSEIDEDFWLNYPDNSYWIRVLPRHQSLTDIDQSYGGEFQESWGTAFNGAGVLKLVHIKIHYSFVLKDNS